MKATLNGSELSIRVPLAENGKRSRSGKTTVVADSQGMQFIGKWNGKPTFLQLNVIQAEAGSPLARTAGNVIEMSSPVTSRKKPQHRVTSAGQRSNKVTAA